MPQDDQPNRWRRLRRRVVRVLLVVLLVVIALVGGLYLFLQTSAGRNVVRGLVESQINRAIRGHVTLGELAELSLGEVRLKEIALFDESGDRVVGVRQVVVEPDLRALIGGDIALRRVLIEGPNIDLRVDDQGRLTLLDAVASRSSPSPEPEEPGPPTVVRIGEIRVQGGVVTTNSEAARGLSIRELSLSASIEMAATATVELEQLELAIANAERSLFRLESASAHIDTTAGAENRLDLSLSSSSDRVALGLRGALVEGGRLERIDARVELDPITPEVLRELGLTELAEPLPDWMRGSVTAQGAIDDLSIGIDLDTPGGPLAIQGRIRDMARLDVRLGTPGLELAQVSAALPDLRVAVDLEAASSPTPDGDRRVELRLDGASVGQYAVPPVSANVVLATDAVILEDLWLPQLEDRFHLSGRYAFEGAADVSLTADRLDLADLPTTGQIGPDLAGTLEGHVNAHIELGDEPQLSSEVDLRLRALGVEQLSAETLRVTGTTRGALTTPRVDLEIETTALAAGDTRVERAALRVDGGPTDYRIDGTVAMADGPTAELGVDVGLGGERDALEIAVDGLLDIEHGGERLRLAMAGISIEPGREVRAARVEVTHPAVRLVVSGTYGFEGTSDLEVTLSRLDLALFDGRLGLPDLPLGGVVSGDVAVRGRADAPDIDAELTWRDGRVSQLSEIAATVSAHYDASALSLELDARGEPGLEARVRAEARLPGRLSAADAIFQADIETDVAIHADDLTVANLFAAGFPVTGGPIDITVTGSGTLDRPSLTAQLRAEEVTYEDRPPLAVDTRIELSDGALSARAGLTDEVGPLLSLDAHAELAWEDVRAGRIANAVTGSAWEIGLEVPRRDLQSLGLPLGSLAEVPFEMAAEAAVTGEPGEFPSAQAHVELHRRGDGVDGGPAATPERGGDDGGCPPQGALTVTLDTRIEDGQSTVEGVSLLDGAEIARVELTAATPLSEWLELGFPDTPPAIDATLALTRLDLSQLPVICRDGRGTLSVEGELADLLTDRPSLSLMLQGRQLSYRDSSPLALDADLMAESTEASAHLRVSSPEGGEMALDLRAPLTWNASSPTPAPGEGPLAAELVLTELALAPLAPLVPPLRRGSGRIDGRLTLDGPLADLLANGEVRLSDVDVTVPGLDQRLSDLSGRIAITPDRLVLDDVRARDRDGTIRIDGAVEMEGLVPRRANLTVVADEFPSRQAGIIIAELTARTRVTADLGPDETRAEVRFEELAVALSEDVGRSVQSLETHPDVVYVDAQVPDVQVPDALPEAGSDDAEPLPAAKPIHLRVIAENPFWVRRPDFAIQMTANLTIDIEANGMRISGPVRLLRGTLTLMGKTFDIQESTITFAGGSRLDPQLEIVAIHELSRYPGETVTVRIEGRLSGPNLVLSSTVPGVTTDAQVVQLLVTGRVAGDEAGGTGSAENDVASFLGGLTAGLLTMTARRELGNAVPIISVQTGEAVSDVEVRAGFVADRIIPRFMRGFVTGLYVEGFVGTEEEGQGAEAERVTTGGFLIELYFTHGLLGRGTFQPPVNWSIDLLWEP